MTFYKNNFLFILFGCCLLVFSCQEQKQNNNDDSESKSHDSLLSSMTIMKSYVRKLDEALLETNNLESLLNESDSAKRALMSRDKDMVRINETDKVPVIDTISGDGELANTESADTELILQEANNILVEAKGAIRSFKGEIEIKRDKYSEGFNGADSVIAQEFQTHMKESEEIIAEAEKEIQHLEKEIEKVEKDLVTQTQ